ncbi:hypothetical protein P4P50_004795 [Salmonella enterica]|nr:hypothetical protein [Salmonella enterica]EJC0948207.1 hypothetical protein [Salmonella enterica]EKQ0477276.1 hypothetical protein [Salmonella enterica]EKQ0639824.1 hypothetical protein [Salmonella enterica]
MMELSINTTDLRLSPESFWWVPASTGGLPASTTNQSTTQVQTGTDGTWGAEVETHDYVLAVRLFGRGNYRSRQQTA